MSKIQTQVHELQNLTNVELWITSIHNGQLLYEYHSTHPTVYQGMAAARIEGRAVRAVLVELKHNGEAVWAAAPDRRGHAFNRFLDAGLLEDEDEDDEAGRKDRRK